MKRIVLIDQDYFGVSFPYNASIVERVKRLSNRRWNPDERQWEIHLAHLPEVMVILRLSQTMLPPDVRKAYAENWQGVDVVVRIDNARTVLSGGDVPLDAVEEETSYWIMGAEHTRKYKDGKWVGMRRLLDKRNFAFPTEAKVINQPPQTFEFRRKFRNYRIIDLGFHKLT